MGYFAKEVPTEDLNRIPVSYYGHDLWRCKDGSLRNKNGTLFDVGNWDLYLRIPIQENKEGTILVNLGPPSTALPYHGRGEPLFETDHLAVEADTNFPPKHYGGWDETLDLLELSWHLQVVPANVEAVQRFLSQTLFEFYTGGDKPYYQCNMAVMARWEPYAVRGTFVLVEPLFLRHIEKRLVKLQLSKASAIPLDLFLRMGCRRYRGIA